MRRICRVHYAEEVATNQNVGKPARKGGLETKPATPHDATLRAVAADARLAPEENGVVRGMKTSERIAATIVSDITSQGLVPGDRLPNEAAMIERFGLGRGSIREALRILEVHGIIQLRSGPGGGPVVAAVRPRDVARTFSLYLNLVGATMSELVDARSFLEPYVARLAAEYQDPDGNARLREALAHEERIEDGDSHYIQAANEFHYVVGSMTGNRVINLVATSLKELYTSRVVGGGMAGATTAPSIRLEHRAIGEAILAGDGDLAEELMRVHMNLYLGRVRSLPGVGQSVITWS
jgi:GntR family transcriptional regulator, transcriptional repressor for pyruvate dehydrogenase complex